MIGQLRTLQNALAKTIAAIVILVFWCVTTVGTTIGMTVGLTSLATAINAATSSPAKAGRRYRRRGWRRAGWGGLSLLPSALWLRLSLLRVRLPLSSSWLVGMGSAIWNWVRLLGR
jgi:hypothetical protein